MSSVPRADPYEPLRNPHVRALALGRMAASLGAQFISVAVGWELYERTGDPWALGLVGLFEIAPVLLLIVPAGQAADRHARRSVAMVAYALLAVASLGLASVSWRNAPVELVYALLVAIGAARTFASPSVGSLLPQLVEPRQLASAQAWLISSGQLASISGPALAGLLIALFGSAGWVYVIAAACDVSFVLLLAGLPSIKPRRQAGRIAARDLFAGLGFVRRSPVFLAAITLDLFAVLLGGAVALLPIFAKDVLDVGPTGLGLLRAAPAFGALVAALVVARGVTWARPGRLLLWVVAGFGLAIIGFGLSTNFVLSLVCLFLTGAFDSISMVIRDTLAQVITPDHLRGRVAAVEHLFVGFSNELGAFESGAAAALFGPIAAVVGGGVGTIVVVIAIALAWPQLARIGPLHTLAPAEEPEPAPTRA